MDVTLVMFKADGTRRDFPVRKDRVVVGRTGTCDLRIPLSSVSRRHCEIVNEPDAVRLRDLGSSNGTFHNSTRVTEILLQPGDEIGIGPVVFTVVIDGEPSDVEPIKTIVRTRSSGSDDATQTSFGDTGPARGEPLDIPNVEGDSGTFSPSEEQFTPTVNLEEAAGLGHGADDEDDEPEGLSIDDQASDDYDNLPSFDDDDANPR